jgi:hypothetical protein
VIKSLKDGPQFFLLLLLAVRPAPIEALARPRACQQHQSFAAVHHPSIVGLFAGGQLIDVLCELHELREEGEFDLVLGGREGGEGEGEELPLGGEDGRVGLGGQRQVGAPVDLGLDVLLGAVLPGQRPGREVEQHVEQRLQVVLLRGEPEVRAPRAEPDVADEGGGPAHLEVVGQSEVNQLDAVLIDVQHHVLGLEVSMQVPRVVQVPQRSHHLPCDQGRGLQSELLPPLHEYLLQVAIQSLHDEE